MQIIGSENITYILLSGIRPTRNIKLAENIELQPADCSHLDLDTALSACSHPHDITVVTGFIPITSAQFAISAATPKELATVAWNSSWDALLLSAFFRTEIGFNLQSNVPANEISADTVLRATNHQMYGLNRSSPYELTDNDMQWLSRNFGNARYLLDNERYQTAVHCLATYRWHTMPRVQLAILWAGIEGMFGASTEIRFRISIYIARFLHPDDADARRKIFDTVKKLYNLRSAAVHGSNIKGDAKTFVEESASILCALLKHCTILNAMPNENELVP
jgi:hypothetical protein